MSNAFSGNIPYDIVVEAGRITAPVTCTGNRRTATKPSLPSQRSCRLWLARSGYAGRFLATSTLMRSDCDVGVSGQTITAVAYLRRCGSITIQGNGYSLDRGQRQQLCCGSFRQWRNIPKLEKYRPHRNGWHSSRLESWMQAHLKNAILSYRPFYFFGNGRFINRTL